MDTSLDPQNIIGRTVFGSDGEKLGKAGQVFLDDQTNNPEWVTVHTGLFGTKETFIPLRDATMRGDDLVTPYDKDRVKGAPNVDADGGHLSETEEDELFAYYGVTSDYSTTGNLGTDSGIDRSVDVTSGIDRSVDIDATSDLDRSSGTVGHDTSGPTTDDAMTRSEEQLRVGTEKVEAGRARLRKYVTTEQVTTTVPVTREHVTVEREAITDANRGDALSGPSISEEEHEVILTEERPVVATETVPVERVKLGVEQETVQETVTGEVRKEQIDLTDAEGVTTESNRDRI